MIQNLSNFNKFNNKNKRYSYRNNSLLIADDKEMKKCCTNENMLHNFYYNKTLIIPDNREIFIFRNINKKYTDKFLSLISSYKDPESTELGQKIIELSNEYNKEIVSCAEHNNIKYISFLQISTKELKENTAFIDKIFKTIEKENPDFLYKKNGQLTSFKAKIVNKLTPEQRKKAHLIIHSNSLICAGVSAVMGEANLTGADIPILVTIETGMFARLIEELDTSMSAGYLHAAKHMFSAGTIGGLGNIGISAYLRTSNAALSALLCEYMGWEFVKDYKAGKMTPSNKLKEGLSFAIFYGLIYSFDNILDLEHTAGTIEDKAMKTLGKNIASNISSENAQFVNNAMKFLAHNPISKTAKGIELITPAIAKHLVENEGKLDNNFLETVIKGSIYSLVCTELLGNIDENEIIKEKAKKYIAYMENHPAIKNVINKGLITKGIKIGTKCILDKNTISSLESLYNELTPICVELVKNVRSV